MKRKIFFTHYKRRTGSSKNCNNAWERVLIREKGSKIRAIRKALIAIQNVGKQKQLSKEV